MLKSDKDSLVAPITPPKQKPRYILKSTARRDMRVAVGQSLFVDDIEVGRNEASPETSVFTFFRGAVIHHPPSTAGVRFELSIRPYGFVIVTGATVELKIDESEFPAAVLTDDWEHNIVPINNLDNDALETVKNWSRESRSTAIRLTPTSS